MLTNTLNIGIQQCSTNIELFRSKRNIDSTAMTILNCTKLYRHQYKQFAVELGRAE